ncbi:NACHT domain-containing protein [Mycena sanguinolenta]|uniref:NACHT domain-containing protein n=1 Tax=Mycena sanguinolenta TaxID=230812 RepID=A0A8H7DK13_9AGAR|nr:NACHT domain-containing protein [Mycena sanguinolenta]
MAFCENSQAMHINGGTFYNVAGTMNVQQQIPVATLGKLRRVGECHNHQYLESKEAFRWEQGAHYEPYSTSGCGQIASHLHQLPSTSSFPAASQRESNPTSHDSSLGANSTLTPIAMLRRESALQTVNNYFSGGIGGRGGEGYASGTGGAGGCGMGLNLSFDVSAGNLTMNNLYHHGERGINILHNAVALAALHDSGESFPQPRCHPETRTEMMQKLNEWSMETDPSTTILWLHGPAGAGKSAIMQTFCSELQAARRLGGSFFFKRDHATRGNAKSLFATIAYQLAFSVPWLKAPICRNVEEDPTILARSLQLQLQKLIFEPAWLHPVDDNQKPIMIVIDGLDECESQHVQEDILRGIRGFTSKYHLPFRFIVASRPEAHICEVFESPSFSGEYRSFNVEQSFEDVQKYLSNEFSRIHGEHRTMANIPSPWPSPETLQELVSRSSGYFIYASTVIQFIDDKHYRPTERLAVILDGTSSDSAFDGLDQLYIKILSSIPRQAQLLPVLCAIANFDYHPKGLDKLLGLERGDAWLLLRGLHSVLHIPEEDNHNDWIFSHHASFFEFLENPRRSRDFYIGNVDHRMDLARSLLGLFAGEFQEEIDYFFENEERSPLSFISFVTSLPPSAELLSSIKRLNPDYVFERYEDSEDFDKFLQWLKKIPGAPTDLVELWEDYEYMSFFVTEFDSGKFNPTLNEPSVVPAPDIVFQVPGMRGLLQILMLVMECPERYLREIRPLTGLTWDDLKTTICALRPIIGRDVDKIRELADHMLHGSFFGEIYPWPTLCWDLARQLICRARATGSIKKGLKRSSPLCYELLYDVWTTYDDLSSYPWYMYHVSKWLERFPNPLAQLLAFCRKSCENLDTWDREYEDSHWRKFMNLQG